MMPDEQAAVWLGHRLGLDFAHGWEREAGLREKLIEWKEEIQWRPTLGLKIIP
jgi:hypothetical protein